MRAPSIRCNALVHGRSLWIVPGLVLALLRFNAASVSADHGADVLEGVWEGTLKTASADLRVLFHISKNANGYAATMDSPDQQRFGVHCNSVSLQKDNVHIVAAIIGGQFVGKLSSDGNEIAGF